VAGRQLQAVVVDHDLVPADAVDRQQSGEDPGLWHRAALIAWVLGARRQSIPLGWRRQRPPVLLHRASAFLGFGLWASWPCCSAV